MNNKVTRDEYAIPSAGMRLRSAREQLGISQKTIAERLCLKVSTVRDLEEDKVPTDLALTFLLGYIRSYARLVHISEKELLSIMKEFKEKVGMTNLFPLKNLSSRKYRKNRDSWLTSLMWLTLFVVVGLASAWWLKNQRAKQGGRSVIMTDRSTSRLNNIDNILLNGTDVTDSTHHTPEVDKNSRIITSSIETLNTDSNILTMNFTDNCWLEITDLTGRILFSGFQHKNDNLSLVGQSPYKLKIGAPKAIKIQYLGKIIDLSNFIKTKQVAHLSLSADR